MSLAPLSPLIMDWMKNELKWKFVWQPTYRPIEIPANGEIRIPRGDFTFEAPEGILLTLVGVFDSPYCGIRWNTQQLDTKRDLTINQMGVYGALNSPFFVSASVPPNVQDGTYVIQQYKEWPWTQWCELYLINEDSIPHNAITFSYTLALLMEKRPPDPILALAKTDMALKLYPELEGEIKKILKKSNFDITLQDLKALTRWDANRVKEVR